MCKKLPENPFQYKEKPTILGFFCAMVAYVAGLAIISILVAIGGML